MKCAAWVHQNPVGKLLAGQGRRVNRIKTIHPCSAFGQPDVQSFGVVQIRSLQPPIFLGAITNPSHKVAVTMTTMVLIHNIADEILLFTIFCGDGWWFAEFPTREK